MNPNSVHLNHPIRFFLQICLWAGVTLLLGNSSGRAEEEKAFSAKISVEGGSFQASGSDLSAYQFSRLELESQQDLMSGLSYGLEGEALWQTSSVGMPPPEFQFPMNNALKLEYDNGSENFYKLELNRAYLRVTSGRLDMSAGLWRPQWGSAHFYKPTDYFFPVQPLQWQGFLPEGSEGMDATCFLFDDLSFEGAVRWLEGGNAEWVLRLINKGIGISVTPSFASLLGRNGMGVELSGTFPDFQARLEDVEWIRPDGTVQSEWVAGVSTLKQGIAYSIEVFRDETGGVLGSYSAVTSNATYFFTSMEKSFPGGWKISPALVKSFEGGPFLFWPKASWGFTPSWELGLQGQLKVGTIPGPLSLVPNRLGFSISYSL